jgi:hypothetical protein
MAPQAQLVLVAAHGGLGDDKFVEGVSKGAEAVVVAKNVVDLAPAEFLGQFVQPSQGGCDAGLFGGESAPSEVEGVSIQDEHLGTPEIRLHFLQETITHGSPCEQVEIGDDQASFHAGTGLLGSGPQRSPRLTMSFMDAGSIAGSERLRESIKTIPSSRIWMNGRFYQGIQGMAQVRVVGTADAIMAKERLAPQELSVSTLRNQLRSESISTH